MSRFVDWLRWKWRVTHDSSNDGEAGTVLDAIKSLGFESIGPKPPLIPGRLAVDLDRGLLTVRTCEPCRQRMYKLDEETIRLERTTVGWFCNRCGKFKKNPKAVIAGFFAPRLKAEDDLLRFLNRLRSDGASELRGWREGHLRCLEARLRAQAAEVQERSWLNQHPPSEAASPYRDRFDPPPVKDRPADTPKAAASTEATERRAKDNTLDISNPGSPISIALSIATHGS